MASSDGLPAGVSRRRALITFGAAAGAATIGWSGHAEPAHASTGDETLIGEGKLTSELTSVVPGASIEEFIAYIRDVYHRAVTYGGDRDPSQLVMEWLRYPKYNDAQWTALIGDIDQGFIDTVQNSGPTRIDEVYDPLHRINLGAAHFGASCNGAFVKGQADGSSTNRGDVAGWGGDLITFYGEWRRDSATFPSGYVYCTEKLARIDNGTTFELTDLLEDADAYNVATSVLAGLDIADAVHKNYTGTAYRSRLQRFERGRFGSGHAADVVARDMLTSVRDALIDAGRAGLIQAIAGTAATLPAQLPTAELVGFCRGFAEVLSSAVRRERVGVEDSKR